MSHKISENIFLLTLFLFIPFLSSAEVLNIEGDLLKNFVTYSYDYGCLAKPEESIFGIVKLEQLPIFQFKVLSNSQYRKRLKKLRNRRRQAKERGLAIRVANLRKKIKGLKGYYKTCINTGYITPTPVIENHPPTAQSQSIELQENSETPFFLYAQDEDGDSLQFVITEYPAHGAIEINGNSVQYTPEFHYLGGDSFSFKVSDGELDSNQASVAITIIPGQLEFAGDPFSIKPYRNQITEREARNVLKKLGDGNSQVFLDAAANDGLFGFVDELISFTPDIEDTGLLTDLPLDDNGNMRTTAARQFMTGWYLKGNPLRQTLIRELMDWFPASTAPVSGSSSTSHLIEDYINQFFDASLTFNSEDLVNGAAKGTFERLLYNQVRDGLMLMYLDNRYNTQVKPNENYGRELMELFSLGTTDPLTGELNYLDSSIMPASRAVTGYKLIYSYDANKYSWSFVSADHDYEEKIIFEDTPWEATGNFDHDSFVEYVLYNHPGAARYIAGQLFTRLVHPNLNEELLDTLATTLRDQMAYHIGDFVEMLLKSSAMYSTYAVNGCVAEPLNMGRRYIRNLEMPVNLSSYSSSKVLYQVENYTRLAGESSFSPKSVFGMEGCGVIRGTDIHKGEKFLTLTNVLNRINLINRINSKENGEFDVDALLVKVGLEPSNFVDYIDEVFSINLTVEERELLIDYLGEWGWPADPAARSRKVYGVLWIMMNMPNAWLK